jgi:glutamine synthetase
VPIALLNAAVAEALGEFEAAITTKAGKKGSFQDAVLAVIKEAVVATKAIRFEGNNYAPEWVVEAKRRGLPNLRTSPEALAELVKPDSKAFLAKMKVFTEAESEARYHVKMERYVKDVEIEVETLTGLVAAHVLPAALKQRALLGSAGNSKAVQGCAKSLDTLIGKLTSQMEALEEDVEKAGKATGVEKKALLLAQKVVTGMAEIRETADAIEESVADAFWTLPKYHEMLFLV